MKFFKRLFCHHEYEIARKFEVQVDEFTYGTMVEHRCKKCGKTSWELIDQYYSGDKTKNEY